MSTSHPIRFSVHFVVDRASWTPSEWRVKARGQVPGYGKPSNENLAKHALFVEASTAPGGVNAHLGYTKILKAHIVDNDTGVTVATYERSHSKKTEKCPTCGSTNITPSSKTGDYHCYDCNEMWA